MMNPRNLLVNGPTLHAFDKYDRKFYPLSSKQSRLSENSQWILQVDHRLEEDLEVKTIIEEMFSPGDLENQFIKIYKQTKMDKKLQDENKSFFKQIKAIKLFKI